MMRMVSNHGRYSEDGGCGEDGEEGGCGEDGEDGGCAEDGDRKVHQSQDSEMGEARAALKTCSKGFALLVKGLCVHLVKGCRVPGGCLDLERLPFYLNSRGNCALQVGHHGGVVVGPSLWLPWDRNHGQQIRKQRACDSRGRRSAAEVHSGLRVQEG